MQHCELAVVQIAKGQPIPSPEDLDDLNLEPCGQPAFYYLLMPCQNCGEPHPSYVCGTHRQQMIKHGLARPEQFKTAGEFN